MYWGADEIEDYIRFPIEGSSEEIGSPIFFVAKGELQSQEVMAELREELLDRGFDYAPIRPYHYQEFYDVHRDEVRPIEDEQQVRYKDVILHCVNILTEYPFVMVRHPDNDSCSIVTQSDLNTRMAKEYLYSYYAETARAVSQLIESEYDPEEIQDVYERVRSNGRALNRWERAVDENVNLHPVEFMSMADFKEVVAGTESLRDQLQFPSKTKCREAFDLVEDYRNAVMHGYRTVVLSQDDVLELAESLEVASEMTIHAGGDGPGIDIPP